MARVDKVKKKISVDFSPADFETVRRCACSEGQTLSEFVRSALKERVLLVAATNALHGGGV